MRSKHKRTLERICARPVSGTIRWADIEALFSALGAEITQREGSRVQVYLFGEDRVFHRPHPSPETDKGAVASIRDWVEENGVRPLQKGIFLPPALFANAHLLLNTLPLLLSLRTKISVFLQEVSSYAKLSEYHHEHNGSEWLPGQNSL